MPRPHNHRFHPRRLPLTRQVATHVFGRFGGAETGGRLPARCAGQFAGLPVGPRVRRPVREPEGNGVAERFIRILEENFLWVRSFEAIEELRQALLGFERSYNEQWMLEKYHYRSPAQVRRDIEALDEAA